MPRLYDNIRITPKSGSLSAIIGSYKSIVTRRIHNELNDLSFSWQSRFYDHVIRNNDDLMRVAEYIENNPLQWELDEENPERAEEIKKARSK